MLTDIVDDVVLIEALHAHSIGLLPGFKVRVAEKWLAEEACNGEHWLALYEAGRQGWISKVLPRIKADGFMASMLSAGVFFYDTQRPAYGMVVATGSAPPWIVDQWIRKARHRSPKRKLRLTAIERLLAADLRAQAREREAQAEQLVRMVKAKAKRSRATASQY
ncbi:MAG: hypothetical protein U0704_01735 [Candidatus Eisenbacteria bacterium]